MVGLPILTRKDICSREVSRMANLFTNQKEIKRAIKAAVDQYEIHRRYTLANAWREVNTTYHGPGPDQGNFTHDGKLMIGYMCN